MGLPEKIIDTIKKLPESKQIEILDFVQYLQSKAEREEDQSWKDLSLSSAMRGLEDEESPYVLDDLKERFS